MSRETVEGEGMVRWGRPAERMLRSLGSLTIFDGLLFSVTHLTIRALMIIRMKIFQT
jgi:hypothetical protein